MLTTSLSFHITIKMQKPIYTHSEQDRNQISCYKLSSSHIVILKERNGKWSNR